MSAWGNGNGFNNGNFGNPGFGNAGFGNPGPGGGFQQPHHGQAAPGNAPWQGGFPQGAGQPAGAGPYGHQAPGGFPSGGQFGQGQFGQNQFGQHQPPGGAPQPRPPRRRGKMAPLFGLCALAVVAVIAIVVALDSLSGPEYANEGYVPAPATNNPEPLPEPAADATVEDLLENNSLYAQQAASPVRCEMEPIDPSTASDQELEAHIDQLNGCLMAIWEPAFAGTEYELVRPRANVYGESVVTPCNSGEAMGPNALYCPANQEVYWSTELSKHVPEYGQPMVIDMVMSHEFAHGVQARVNIGLAWQYEASQVTEREALTMSRRSEAQADCMAGMALSAMALSREVTDDEFNNIIAATKAGGADIGSGDPTVESTHPHADTRDYWMRQGLNSTGVGTCNTWTAPEEHVR